MNDTLCMEQGIGIYGVSDNRRGGDRRASCRLSEKGTCGLALRFWFASCLGGKRDKGVVERDLRFK